jgi:hypothetical protein
VANPRLRPEDLTSPHKTGNCDLSPEACLEVGGQFLPFPG